MNSRTTAGLGMILLAAGLLTIYFLDFDFSQFSSGKELTENPAPSLAPGTPVDGTGPRDISLFLEEYNTTFKSLWNDAEAARWASALSQTDALETTSINTRRRLYDYTGSRSIIERLRQYRGRLDANRLQERQIERAWRMAALYPATSAEAVMSLMDLEVALADSLKNTRYHLELSDGKSQNKNLDDLASQLARATAPTERLIIWETAQTLGPKLKEDLIKARDLRNKLARTMGYSSYFAVAAARYGMEMDELMALLDGIVTSTTPLYQQLHCFVKNRMAPTYGSEVPRLIPGHWVPTLDGGKWSVAGVTPPVSARMDSLFLGVQPQWILEQTENFLSSLGFPPLPLGFWGRSSLFPLPADSEHFKSQAAEAWHLDLDQDVRAMMTIEADYNSYSEAHRIIAETFYHLAYSHDDVPVSLRQGANPALIPALGKLMELAGSTVPALMDAGLVAPEQTPATVDLLLYRAMNESVMAIPLLCGTLAHWEYDLYEKDRGEMDCTPAIRADVTNNPTRGMDDVLALIIAHQLHRYICKNILNEDVRLANYRGRTAVGRYLQSIMQLGATRDWMQVMRESTGEELSSEALLEYYQPLSDWLMEQNAGQEADFSLVGENQAP